MLGEFNDFISVKSLLILYVASIFLRGARSADGWCLISENENITFASLLFR